ncbi:MAG: LysR substrate-binding domain-containing protein, partial [Brachybacterium sp.]
MHSTPLRVGFVPGVEPDRFLRRWKSGHRDAWLELVPVPLSRQHEALTAGEVDMCFVRLPLVAEELHMVSLWEERAAIMVGTENVLSLLDEVGEEDLV